MELKDLQNRALEVRKKYIQLQTEQYGKPWNVAEIAQGLTVDIGELTELIMAKNKMRKYKGTDLDTDLAHEMSDVLWNFFVIADELNMDLEKEFMKTMDQLDKKFENNTI